MRSHVPHLVFKRGVYLASLLCVGVICGCGGSSGTVERDPRGEGFGAISLLEGMDWSARWVAVRGLWVPMSGSVLGRYQTSKDEPDHVLSTIRLVQANLRNFSLKCRSKLVSFERDATQQVQMGLVIRTNQYQSVEGNDLPRDFTGIRCFLMAYDLSPEKKSFGLRLYVHEDEGGQVGAYKDHTVLLEGIQPHEQFEGVTVEHEIICKEKDIVYSAIVRFPVVMGIEPQRLGPVRYRVKTIREGCIGMGLYSVSSRLKGLDATVSFEDLVLTPLGNEKP